MHKVTTPIILYFPFLLKSKYIALPSIHANFSLPVFLSSSKGAFTDDCVSLTRSNHYRGMEGDSPTWDPGPLTHRCLPPPTTPKKFWVPPSHVCTKWEKLQAISQYQFIFTVTLYPSIKCIYKTIWKAVHIWWKGVSKD